MNYVFNDDYLITDGLPDSVPLLANFNHPKNRLDYYESKLRDTGVRVPETKYFPVEIEKSTQKFDEGPISQYMVDNGWKQAFVRGMYASAKYEPMAGSHIHSQDRDAIRETVCNLIGQMVRLDVPLGDRIAVREWLDLDYCARDDHFHRSEVRYFIRDGEVVYRSPSEEKFMRSSLRCDAVYSYVQNDFDDGINYPDHAARHVAEIFDELSWSVDFARDAKSGRWYCIDMGLNGLYWNEAHKKWVAISEHPEKEYSPERYHDM